MNRFTYILIFLLVINELNAQSEQPLLLRNTKVFLSEDLDGGLAIRSNETSERYYRLVQFNNLGKISLGQSESEFTVLEYVPEKAFIVSIDRNAASGISEIFMDKGAMAASPILPEWKLSKGLLNKNYSAWAMEGNKVLVWIKTYQDHNFSAFKEKMAPSYEILEEDSKSMRVLVKVAPDSIGKIAALPYVSFVFEKEPPAEPYNYLGRTNHRISYLQSSTAGTLTYDGSGVVIGVRDDGKFNPPHIDYKNRVELEYTGQVEDHGDHVVGTILGAGNLNPLGRGMAPGAEVHFRNSISGTPDYDREYLSDAVRVTSNSYGLRACNNEYRNGAIELDKDAFENPSLIHVFAAGNSGTVDCGYGAGAGWGNISDDYTQSKNIVCVGNITHTDALTSSSSRGPAGDGRIKPDVVAVGTNVFSTISPNTYAQFTGTSMATPGVAGTLAVLYEAWRTHHLSDPPVGLLKSILMNTCDDIGNPGPDFKFGYGRINARRACEVIKSGTYLVDSLTAQVQARTYQVNVPSGTAELRVMLYWSDPPASLLAAKALVNDLDLEVLDSSATVIKPWVLDTTSTPALLNANAVRGRDYLNNVEQITITDPAAGQVTINVTGFNVPSSSQEFYVVYEYVPDSLVLTHPIGGEAFVPGETQLLRWDAPYGTTPFALDYSIDNGTNWINITQNIPADQRYWQWQVPLHFGKGKCKIRLRRGTVSVQSPGTFSIIDTPTNLRISRICQDSLQLDWDVVQGASGYVVYQLGSKYMDSVAVSPKTTMKLPVQDLSHEEWFSVAAITRDSSIGRRALAIQKSAADSLLHNCWQAHDLSISIPESSAMPGALPDCFSGSFPLSVRIYNEGLYSAHNFDINYSINGGPVQTQNLTDTIIPGSYFDYTFPGAPLNPSSGTLGDVKVWITYATDQQNENDSAFYNLILYPGTSVSYPYYNDFEGFTSCSVTPDCGQSSCTLQGGWFNANNTELDDIDWRVNSGPTATSSTGPSQDQNPGTTSGKYLYLESSGNCDSSEAILLSPCIDLDTAVAPVLEFWVHMSGNNMGTLAVDVFDSVQWHMNVMPALKGSQSNVWEKVVVDLAAFTGKEIIIRFRGKTGNGDFSDVALDNIAVHENTNTPVAQFVITNSQACASAVVRLTDQSLNAPTSLRWKITPSTFVFLEGNNSSSDPLVQFTDPAIYQITLVASNGAGIDSLKKASFKGSAGAALPLPFKESFEGNFLPMGWVQGQNSVNSWSSRSVAGASGGQTKAASFDNFNSGGIGETNDLITPGISLVSAAQPLLFFDVAYAASSTSSSDSLIVEVSDDCGISYYQVGYRKGGGFLQTAPPFSSLFAPSSSAQWRRDTIDLSAFIGSKIKIRFRNYSGGGNAVYLDNIQVLSQPVAVPQPEFLFSDSIICAGGSILFTNMTNGSHDTVYWDFGAGAVPRGATASGPHNIYYNSTGTKQVTLAIGNDGVFRYLTREVEVIKAPVAYFSAGMRTNQLAHFSDMSTGAGTLQWHWDFGDGDTSALKNPSHFYDTNGTYSVVLQVSNGCGTDSDTMQLTIDGVPVDSTSSLREFNGLSDLYVFPNPGSGMVTLSLQSMQYQFLDLELINPEGIVLKRKELEVFIGQNDYSLDLSSLATGMYLLHLRSDEAFGTFRIIKQ